MSSKNSMTRDAMLFLPAKVAEGLLIIACSSLYTHIFYEDTVGIFNFLNFNVQIVYLVLAGWMTNAAARYVGEEYHHDGGRNLFSTIMSVYLLLCAGVTVFCVAAAVITRDKVYLGTALMFACYTLFQILNAVLIQLGRMRASIGLSLLSALCKVVVAYALVYGMKNPASPFPAIFANIIADGVAGLGAVAVLCIPQLARLRFFSKPLLGRFLKFGMPLMGVSISVSLLNQIDKYLVVGLYGNTNYAYYSSNNSIASGLFTMLSIGIMRGVYPAVLRAWREGGRTQTQPLLDHGVRLYLLVAVPAVCGLTAISLPMSRFLFAPGYEAGAIVIAYTALAMLFMGLTEYANKAYELEQSTIHVLQNSAAAAVVKIISSFLLMRVLGFTGGALGSVVAFAFYFALTCLRVRHRFLFRVGAARLVRIVLCGLLCGGVAFACTLLPVSNLLRLLFAVIAGGATYAVSIVLCGEARGEFAAVVAKLRK